MSFKELTAEEAKDESLHFERQSEFDESMSVQTAIITSILPKSLQDQEDLDLN